MAVLILDARHLSDEVLEAFRLRAVAAHEAGYTEDTIARILGVRQETVSRWCCAYRRTGRDGLPHERTGRPTGSGRWLSEEQEQHLQELMHQSTPLDLGIASTLWTREAMRELVAHHYGLRLPIRTVGLYLQRWGWTPQRPLRKAYRQDPEEVRHWLEEEYPAIEARARREGAEIHWGDETGVDADESPRRGYAPLGQTPERRVTGGHVRVNMISTVTNGGKVRFMVYTAKMTAALFVEFLRRLLGGATRKIFLIVDNLKAHQGPVVEQWLATHADRIEVFYLPRYAPELNPDEHLNNDVKENVNEEGLATDKKALRNRLNRLMHRLAKLPERVMNYFEDKVIAYAAALP